MNKRPKPFSALVDLIEVDEQFLQYLDNKDDIQGKNWLKIFATLPQGCECNDTSIGTLRCPEDVVTSP